MVLESHIAPASERVRVDLEQSSQGRRVAIRVEGFDPKLGWYSSGSLALTPEQLAMVEQAITDMRRVERSREQHECEIIPFPGCE